MYIYIYIYIYIYDIIILYNIIQVKKQRLFLKTISTGGLPQFYYN